MGNAEAAVLGHLGGGPGLGQVRKVVTEVVKEQLNRSLGGGEIGFERDASLSEHVEQGEE